ncbi:hypothetical protein BB560_003255 [Smittium megazygosporum]|uniref:UBA domain-containing protein n=1 Tax=Smittium megazygosporum TaxID=133381 RepID=A0A2T9ZCN0_9FUNG|nr:hypothetical protein BB560_003255 [Smittium megazygosporum]
MIYTGLEGVKLKFKLPFDFPDTVSLPLDFISETKPVKDIPKYDFELENRIINEEKTYKQEEEMQQMIVAQQQLFVMEYLSKKKNRNSKQKYPKPTQEASMISGIKLNTPTTSSTGINPPGKYSSVPTRVQGRLNHSRTPPYQSNPQPTTYKVLPNQSSPVLNNPKVELSSGTYSANPGIPYLNNPANSLQSMNVNNNTKGHQNYLFYEANNPNPNVLNNNEQSMSFGIQNPSNLQNTPVSSNASQPNLGALHSFKSGSIPPYSSASRRHSIKNQMQTESVPSLPPKPPEFNANRKPQNSAPILADNNVTYNTPNGNQSPSPNISSSSISLPHRAGSANEEPVPLLPPKPFEITLHDYVSDQKIIDLHNPKTFNTNDNNDPVFKRMNASSSGFVLDNSNFQSSDILRASNTLKPPTTKNEDSDNDENVVEQVLELMNMGFSKKESIYALEKFSYNIVEATNYLLDNL